MTQSLLSLFFAIMLSSFMGDPEYHEVVVSRSRFNIKGSTNVNTFSCGIAQIRPLNPVEVTSLWEDFAIHFDNLKMSYSLNNISCGIPMMTQDVKNLLKIREHPNLDLQINTIHISRGNTDIDTLDVSADVAVTLAGVTRDLAILDGVVVNHSESSLTLYGGINLKMTDFSIQPPVKFMMVRVNNEVEIDFEIRMEVDTKK